MATSVVNKNRKRGKPKRSKVPQFKTLAELLDAAKPKGQKAGKPKAPVKASKRPPKPTRQQGAAGEAKVAVTVPKPAEGKQQSKPTSVEQVSKAADVQSGANTMAKQPDAPVVTTSVYKSQWGDIELELDSLSTNAEPELNEVIPGAMWEVPLPEEGPPERLTALEMEVTILDEDDEDGGLTSVKLTRPTPREVSNSHVRVNTPGTFWNFLARCVSQEFAETVYLAMHDHDVIPEAPPCPSQEELEEKEDTALRHRLICALTDSPNYTSLPLTLRRYWGEMIVGGEENAVELPELTTYMCAVATRTIEQLELQNELIARVASSISLVQEFLINWGIVQRDGLAASDDSGRESDSADDGWLDDTKGLNNGLGLCVTEMTWEESEGPFKSDDLVEVTLPRSTYWFSTERRTHILVRLVYYLQTHVFFARRTTGLLMLLRDKARQWCKEHQVPLSVAALQVPQCVAIAYSLSQQEKTALKIVTGPVGSEAINLLRQVDRGVVRTELTFREKLSFLWDRLWGDEPTTIPV